jgi:putative nucleotide binding protein
MWEILEERKKEPFKSFEDIKNRVKLLPNPKELIVKRILMELEGKEDKYRLFVVGKGRF